MEAGRLQTSPLLSSHFTSNSGYSEALVRTVLPLNPDILGSFWELLIPGPALSFVPLWSDGPLSLSPNRVLSPELKPCLHSAPQNPDSGLLKLLSCLHSPGVFGDPLDRFCIQNSLTSPGGTHGKVSGVTGQHLRLVPL